jgi:hypothetical protein
MTDTFMRSIDQSDLSYPTTLDELISENRARFLMQNNWIKYSIGPYLIEATYHDGQGYFFYSENNGLTFQPVYEIVFETGGGRELENLSDGFNYVASWIHST